jgi:hypothetical protein
MLSACWVYGEMTMARVRRLDYARASVGEQAWWAGLEWVLHFLRAHAAGLAAAPRPRALWGFKHPRAAAALPLLHAVLGGELRYVHVLRDPRDLDEHHAHIFVREVCPLLAGGCARTLAGQLAFRARWNRAAIQWLRDHLDERQYLVVRIEDIVSGDAQAFERVARWLARSLPDAQRPDHMVDPRRLREQLAAAAKHAARYSGAKFAPEQRRARNAAALREPSVLAAIQEWGYAPPDSGKLDKAWRVPQLWKCDRPTC